MSRNIGIERINMWLSLLKRLKKNNTWVRIITKSNHSYNGQIEELKEDIITLKFSYKEMKVRLDIKTIESIESCEKSDVWIK
jgi:hypothetical protein